MRNESPLPFLFFLFFVAIICALFSGCISIGTHERMVREAYVNGLQKARRIAHNQHCDEVVALISGRIDVETMKGK